MKLLPEVMNAIVEANDRIAVSETGVIALVVLVECRTCRRLLPVGHQCAPDRQEAA